MSAFSIKTKIYLYIRLARLDKPIGILLLLWPTLWALWIAAEGVPEWRVLAIFVVGTVLMRSAGCVVNDLADADFDDKVERTKMRPLAQREITKKEAALFALLMSLLAFALVLILNRLTIKLSLVALFLAASYPLTKRFFAIPQAYLGVAFGFGIPMAFAAIQQEVPATAWLMLLANVFWTIAYDTAYAMVDREDDLKIGIYSSAITFGRADVWAIMLCYGVFLVLMAYIGYLLAMGVYYGIGLGVAFILALYHYQLIKNRNRAQCFKAFLNNNWLGFSIFCGIFAHYCL